MEQVIAIRPCELYRWWGQVEPLLSKALVKGYGEATIDDLHSMILDNKVVLIVVLIDWEVCAAITTTIIEKPSLKEFIVLTAGGKELDTWLDDIMKAIDNIAKEQDADVISIHGRRGWVKKLNMHGYDEVHTTVIKRCK